MTTYLSRDDATHRPYLKSTKDSNNATITPPKMASTNPDYSGGWQYTSGTVGVKNPGSKVVDYIYIRCCYYNNANGANFDRIQVNIDEYGTSYTYDSDGNLISAKDNAGRYETYGYNSASDMTSLTTADNKAYNFTYSNTYKHRLLSAVSVSSGIKNSFDYDDYGNLTKTTVQKSDGSGRAIKQYNSYTSNGNYLAAAYNDRGYATTYDYDPDSGKLNHVTDPNGNSTYYDYCANSDRLCAVSDNEYANASGASTVGYTYNSNGYLTAITGPTTVYNFSYDTFGNPTSVNVGDKTLVTNSYAEENGNLAQSQYGNDFSVGYTYDQLDRVIGKSYNGSTKYTWRYNAVGQVGYHKDYVSGKVYNYTYDTIGRLIYADVSDGSWFRTNYNEVDQTTSLHYQFANNGRRDVYYSYSTRDNLPLKTRFGPNSVNSVESVYDDLGRLTQKLYTATDGANYSPAATYSYMDWSSDTSRTTGTVRGIDYSYTAGDLSVSDLYYVYDANGNITAERTWQPDENNPLREKYTYDGKNQLIRHDSATQGKSFAYEYDAGGNILSKSEYDYTTGELGAALHTVSYTYGDSSWGDLLTAYNGQTISYDAIGNPTSYLGWNMTWQGRQLASATKDENALSFTYDANGIRTSKTVNGVTTEYFLNGSQILAQKTGESTMWFFYDSAGNRVGLADADNHFYYYIYNLQGDVIAIADAVSGKLAAKYSYDAWGKCASVENADGYTIGTANPFRYRGYYYDTETGLYYLNSRYYDPEVGRFLNADAAIGQIGNVQGTNMFAYCFNNPVNMSDYDGNWPEWIVKAAKWVDKNIMQPLKSFFSPKKESNASNPQIGNDPPDNYMLYSEHRKKGTTSPSNRNTHEKGQARKNRDNRGEKGDARRTPNPNKRNPKKAIIENGTLDRIEDGFTMVGAIIVTIILVGDDFLGVFADDVAIAPQIVIIWDSAEKIFS